jgi:ribokinase
MVGVILVESDGENRIVIAPGVLDQFGPDELQGLAAALAGADTLLVGLEIPVQTAHEALRLGRAAGVRTILNPAPAPSAPLPEGMLSLVDVLTPNRGEAAQLAGMAPEVEPAECIMAPCFAEAGIVALTLSEEGVLLRAGSEVTALPAPAVDVADSTGAGDAFNGALAVALSRSWPPDRAARYAISAAALSVTRREVIASLPTEAEVAAVHDTAGSMR